MVYTHDRSNHVKIQRFHHFGLRALDYVVYDLVFHYFFLFSGDLVSFHVLRLSWTKSYNLSRFFVVKISAFMDKNMVLTVWPVGHTLKFLSVVKLLLLN